MTHIQSKPNAWIIWSFHSRVLASSLSLPAMPRPNAPLKHRVTLSEYHFSIGPGNSGTNRWVVGKRTEGVFELWVEYFDEGETNRWQSGIAIGLCEWPKSTSRAAGIFLLQRFFALALANPEAVEGWTGFDSLGDLDEDVQNAFEAAKEMVR
jgi:hypothetical protein